MRKYLIVFLSLMLITSVSSYAQITPQAMPTPTDTVPGIGDGGDFIEIQHYWNMNGNDVTIMSSTKLGTKTAYPLYFITGNTTRMIIASSGNIGIGTDNPQERLSVDGCILAKNVKINTSSNYWPDYVFSPNYKLMSLNELEEYILNNKHLPGIISAAEVKKQGDVDIGEMNLKLLEKIEELTIYIIELQKQVEMQQIEIDELKRK